MCLINDGFAITKILRSTCREVSTSKYVSIYTIGSCTKYIKSFSKERLPVTDDFNTLGRDFKMDRGRTT